MIYKPKGRAREYSPLGLNIYSGCDHGCRYCYVPGLMRKDKKTFRLIVLPRPNLLQQVERDAKRLSGEDQVLLCFTGDPYCQTDLEYKATRSVLKILLANEIPTAILTKGGSRCLRDLDILKQFGENIKVGATLTFINQSDSQRYEPYAALPVDRMEALKVLHENGVRTWVSFEPVIEPEQTLDLLNRTLDYVDEYKIGKINNYPDLESRIIWPTFLIQAVWTLRKAAKEFYVKEDLRDRCPAVAISESEMDQDRLLVKPFVESGLLFC